MNPRLYKDLFTKKEPKALITNEQIIIEPELISFG